MRAVMMFFLASLLVACSSAPALKLARYDLGEVKAKAVAMPLALSGLDVAAVSWLGGREMHYRLAYAEAQRRYSYAEAQWVAPPAELLERELKQQLLFAQSDVPAQACRLQVVLDELEQRFDQPGSSALKLSVRVMLHPARGDALLAKQAFAVTSPAPSADARGGVAAANVAVQQLAGEMQQWLAAQPATTQQRCLRPL